MNFEQVAGLLLCGFGVGTLAGILGVGGGIILVPILVGLHYSPLHAVATSSLCVAMTAFSATLKNWRQGHIEPYRLLGLAIPGLLTTQLGVFIASRSAPWVLLTSFGALALITLYLMQLRAHLVDISVKEESSSAQNRPASYLVTGGSAGFLSGMLGVGGGVVLVPLQVLLLKEPIKSAVRTSLGVILITSIMSTLGHAYRGNILYLDGLMLGTGGVVGAQLGAALLHKIPNNAVKNGFRSLLVFLSIYVFWQAWMSIVQTA